MRAARGRRLAAWFDGLHQLSARTQAVRDRPVEGAVLVPAYKDCRPDTLRTGAACSQRTHPALPIKDCRVSSIFRDVFAPSNSSEANPLFAMSLPRQGANCREEESENPDRLAQGNERDGYMNARATSRVTVSWLACRAVGCGVQCGCSVSAPPSVGDGAAFIFSTANRLASALRYGRRVVPAGASMLPFPV